MTEHEQIISLLNTLNKGFKRIEKLLDKADAQAEKEDWLPSEKACELLDCSTRKLYNLRKSGQVDFKCRPGKVGRDFKYSRSSLEKLYIII